MNKAIVITFVLFCFLSVNAFPQKSPLNFRWIDIGHEKDPVEVWKGAFMKTSIYLKLYNLEPNDHKVWVRRFHQPYTYKKNGKKITARGTSLSLYDTDCERNMIAVIEVIQYDKNDVIVRDDEFADLEKEWNYVVPGSIGEMIVQEACKLF